MLAQFDALAPHNLLLKLLAEIMGKAKPGSGLVLR